MNTAGRQQDAALKMLELQQRQDAARAAAYAAAYKPQPFTGIARPTAITYDAAMREAEDQLARQTETWNKQARADAARAAAFYRPVDYASLYSQMV